ncbi:hypothetical protein D3C80_1863350 [compost metagenome]
MLAGNGERPPFLIFWIGSDTGHIGLVIRAVIFPVSEQQVFRLTQEDRVVADIAFADQLQNFRPYRSMKPLVLSNHVRLDANDHAHALH